VHHALELVAAAPPEQSTSSVAAALWYPYRAFPEQAVTRWAARSYQVFDGLLTERQAGVRQRTGRELFRAPAADPWWRDAVPGFAPSLTGRPTDRLRRRVRTDRSGGGHGTASTLATRPDRCSRRHGHLEDGRGPRCGSRRCRRRGELHRPRRARARPRPLHAADPRPDRRR